MFFLCDGKSNNANNIVGTLIIHTMHYRERVKENRWQPNISVAFAVLLKAWTRRDDGPIRRVGETFCGSDDEAGKAEVKSSGQNWNSVSDPLQRCLYCIRRAVGMTLLCTVLYSKCQHALCQLLGVLWATAPPPGIKKMHSVTVGHDRARGVTSLFCLDYGRCCLGSYLPHFHDGNGFQAQNRNNDLKSFIRNHDGQRTAPCNHGYSYLLSCPCTCTESVFIPDIKPKACMTLCVRPVETHTVWVTLS